MTLPDALLPCLKLPSLGIYLEKKQSRAFFFRSIISLCSFSLENSRISDSSHNGVHREQKFFHFMANPRAMNQVRCFLAHILFIKYRLGALEKASMWVVWAYFRACYSKSFIMWSWIFRRSCNIIDYRSHLRKVIHQHKSSLLLATNRNQYI